MNYNVVGGTIYVSVPFSRRGDARLLGGWFNRARKQWGFEFSQEAIDILNKMFSLDILKVNKSKDLNQMKQDSGTHNSIAPPSKYTSRVTPFPHQRKAVSLMHEHERYGLFIEMGGGKTKCVVDWYGETRVENSDLKMIIICPKAIFSSWSDELTKHGITDFVIIEGTATKRKKLISTAPIVIMNYEGIQTFVKTKIINRKNVITQNDLAMFDDPNTAIILDESSKIKNPQAKRSWILVRIFMNTKYRFILTGTPITQSPIDVYNQFRFLDADYLSFNSWYSFRNYYCVMGGFMNKEIKGYRNLDILKETIAQHALIVKKKDCAYLDLPDKVYQRRELEMTKELKEQYESMRKDLILELSEDRTITASLVIVKLLRLHQILSGVYTHKSCNRKLNELMEIVAGDLAEEKIIIWCKFTDSINLIANALTEYGISHVRFDGSTVDKQAAIEEFRNDKRVFIGQIETGGMGINLQFCNYMVYFENTFSLQDRLQSEDRCHRPGQKRNVVYIDLLYKETTDMQIINAIADKAKIADYLVSEIKKEV